MGCCCSGLYSICCCQCNFAIFPAPYPSYQWKSDFKNSIQLRSFKNSQEEEVPYLYLTKKTDCKKCIVYFHGNAEDIGYSASFLTPILKQVSDYDIYAIQYPSYGAYTDGCKAKISDRIKSNSIDFFNKVLIKKYEEKNIVIIGRSIGSGGACFMASQLSLKRLILISPFSTIRGVANDHVGFPSCILKQHFDNVRALEKFDGNLLVIHGKIDEVIPYKHGLQLFQNYTNRKHDKIAEMVDPDYMSHNNFNMFEDIVNPIAQFLLETG